MFATRSQITYQTDSCRLIFLLCCRLINAWRYSRYTPIQLVNAWIRCFRQIWIGAFRGWFLYFFRPKEMWHISCWIRKQNMVEFFEPNKSNTFLCFRENVVLFPSKSNSGWPLALSRIPEYITYRISSRIFVQWFNDQRLSKMCCSRTSVHFLSHEFTFSMKKKKMLNLTFFSLLFWLDAGWHARLLLLRWLLQGLFNMSIRKVIFTSFSSPTSIFFFVNQRNYSEKVTQNCAYEKNINYLFVWKMKLPGSRHYYFFRLSFTKFTDEMSNQYC